MNERIQQLTQSLFQKNTLGECSLQDIEGLADAYPYFAPAQLLAAAKAKTADTGLYKERLQKTSLYFHNPLWLDYLLNKQEFQQEHFASPVHDNTKEEADVSPGTIGELIEIEEEKTGAGDVPVLEVVDINEEQPKETPAEVLLNTETRLEAFETASEKSPVPGTPTLPVEVTHTEPVEKKGPVFPDLHIEFLPETGKDVLFEPYHTVDYFASQGIKTVLEEKPKDRFGQQLKSFTEWLKTMKRLPGKEIEQKTDSATEQQVLVLAQHSIEDRDVVTEAMAEVWIKQGNTQKAREVYNKLSLLNPSKSAYFAAKIEQLI